MRKDLPDGAYVLVTDLDASIPSGKSPFVVGYYVDDEQKLSEVCGTPKEALDKAEIYCAIQRGSQST